MGGEAGEKAYKFDRVIVLREREREKKEKAFLGVRAEEIYGFGALMRVLARYALIIK